MVVEYKSYQKRTPDTQYRQLLERILKEGDTEPSPQEYDSHMVFGHQMRFKLSNGFPMITERDVYSGKYSIFNQALGELFAFLSGAQTQKELESFGCRWWKTWTSKEYMEKTGLNLEPGNLGPGSYGAAWTRFPMPDGRKFNQIKGVLEQMKKIPYYRRHLVTPIIPYYIYREVEGVERMVAVAPCHGFFHIKIYVNTGELSLHHFQTSADTPVGLAANLIQYAALTMMFAQVLGYTARELVYTLSDAHMYISDNPERDQRPAVRKLLGTRPQRLPTVEIDPDIKDLFAFRQEHFKVQDYHPQLEKMRIWTPV